MEKIIKTLVVLALLVSCEESKMNLPSGSPKDVLSDELYEQLSKKYDNLSDFEYGYAITKKGKYGLVDYKGKEILSCEYDTIITFTPDAKIIKQNDKYGIIEYNGNQITGLDFNDVKYESQSVSSKIIALKKGQHWGIIDITGKVLVPYEYDNIPSIDTHNAVVGKDGKYGIVDSVGNFTVELKYDTIYYKYENSDISLVELNRCIGLVNSQNKVVTDCVYNCEYHTFSYLGRREPKVKAPKNGYIRFEKFQADANNPKLYGLVECETGKEVIPFEYDDLGDYSEGLIWAEIDRKCGYLDINNRVIIQFKYAEAYNFSEGIAAVAEWDGYVSTTWGRVPNYKIGFIDKNDNIVIPFQFKPQFAGSTPEFHEGLSPMGTSKNNYWGLNVGYINKKGEFVIKPKYGSADSFENGLGIVELNNKTGCINHKGEEVIPIEYDYVWFENDSLVHCSNYSEGTTHYYINNQGIVQKTEIR